MTYRAPVRAAGLRATLAALIRSMYRELPAVRGVSFALVPLRDVARCRTNGVPIEARRPALVRGVDPALLPGGLATAAIAVGLVSLVWRASLRRYTSATS